MSEQRRTALVTGAGRRIGRAIAIALARRGYDIALHYHTSQDAAKETAGEIEQLGRRSVLLRADLRDTSAVESLPEQAVDALGSLSALINNASAFDPMTLESFSIKNWNDALAVNLTAPMLLCRAAHAHLKAAAPACIVNLTDISAARPWPDYLAYCTSKAGLASLTLALARAMAPEVRVNSVAPGTAVFPDSWDTEQVKSVTRRVPAMRAGSAEEVAATVAFLVVDAEYVTGSMLAVDGGRSIAW